MPNIGKRIIYATANRGCDIALNSLAGSARRKAESNTFNNFKY